MNIKILSFALASVLIPIGSAQPSSLQTQTTPELTPELTPADAKKMAKLEKEKERFFKELEKKIASVEKKLKLEIDQQDTVRSYLLPYYAKRRPLVAAFKNAPNPDAKKKARQGLRKWSNQLKVKLTPVLNEKQLKTLDKIIAADMEALNPPPANSGGFGGGGGGGDGGGGGGE